MNDDVDVRAALLGAWGPVSCEESRSDGTVTYPLGVDAMGQLLYAAPDRVSAQLVRADQPRFPDEDYRAAEPARMAAAWLDYFGYFGGFSVDAEAGTVTHHIEAGWFPNLAGSRQERRFHVDGDRLVLSADTAWGQVRNVWRRIG